MFADRRCRAVRDHRAYCDGSSFRRRRCAGDQSGGRERGGGKRDGADRALDSYFVPRPPCRHTSAGLLAHLLGRPLDPDAERSAPSSGRTSSVRLSPPENRSFSDEGLKLPTEVFLTSRRGKIPSLTRANEVRPRTRREISARLLSVSLKKPKSTPMSLVGLMGADHAFYYERARVLLPFRTGARTYVSLHRPRCGSNTARDR